MSPARQDRLTNLAIIALCTAAVSAAAWMRPSESGLGTHEQLGLPACHFYKWTGYPCFSCGMTTSWTWMAHGNPLRAFLAQPMGALLFLTAIVAALWSAWCLWAGGTVERRMAGRGRLLIALFWTGMLGGWAWKIVETLRK
ncbi:MAG: DUF2752 domain-containing protein [Candidatus Brocadiae bacterium]|nr:DUF2752 domain-containing protein [Candidatus Brocadiia bacterium]